jgi:hypothetical protein
LSRAPLIPIHEFQSSGHVSIPFQRCATGGLVLRRVLPPSEDDEDNDGSSLAKALATVFNNALASLIIVAFIPVEGEHDLVACSACSIFLLHQVCFCNPEIWCNHNLHHPYFLTLVIQMRHMIPSASLSFERYSKAGSLHASPVFLSSDDFVELT